MVIPRQGTIRQPRDARPGSSAKPVGESPAWGLALLLFGLPVEAGASSGGYQVSELQGCQICHTGGTVPSVFFDGPTVIPPGATRSFGFTINSNSSAQQKGGLTVLTDRGTLGESSAFLKVVGSNQQVTHSTTLTIGTGDYRAAFTVFVPSGSPCGANLLLLRGWGLAADGTGSLSGDGTATTTRSVTISCPTKVVVEASPNIVLGSGSINASAIVSGRTSPVAGGNIDFKLYGPDDDDCGDDPILELDDVSYPSGGGEVSTPPFVPSFAGLYRWRAFYSGDTNNTAAVSDCDDEEAWVFVDRASPTIATTATAPILLDGQIGDNATVSGRVNPTTDGNPTIVFRAYGPDNTNCAGVAVFESDPVEYPVVGGSVASGTFKPAAPGTYRWRATYSGDSNNKPTTGACNAPGENVRVFDCNTVFGASCDGSNPCPTGFSCTSGQCSGGASTPCATTTTLAPGGVCGDFNGDGELLAGDALGVLRVAVGSAVCALEICDYNGDGDILASDALAVLRAAVGVPSVPMCGTAAAGLAARTSSTSTSTAEPSSESTSTTQP